MPNHLSARKLAAAADNTKLSPAAQAILDSFDAGSLTNSTSQPPGKWGQTPRFLLLCAFSFL